MTTSEESTDEESGARWSVLGIGGLASLCCLLVAPATTGAASGAAAGGTTAALGGGLVQVAVTALTVGALAGIARLSRRRSAD
ncbi:hypothetical protein I7X12_06025 [Halosimplex litoreum]|uniref:Uncharacterized protein n=1 Tax=Halosimplex litoreum TaxID=1198301 RepID=A0A7T3G1E5_9EURY|nr:hypothetical protein [Halosimplex litoreum]QPV64178.1 hypothetical protein I7X12_06025 [Halosimplex litoreum]